MCEIENYPLLLAPNLRMRLIDGRAAFLIKLPHKKNARRKRGNAQEKELAYLFSHRTEIKRYLINKPGRTMG